PKMVSDVAQFRVRTIQYVDLDDRRQLDKRTHSLIGDIVVERELVARVDHAATGRECFVVAFDALEQLDDDCASLEQLPAPVEQLTARDTAERRATPP